VFDELVKHNLKRESRVRESFKVGYLLSRSKYIELNTRRSYLIYFCKEKGMTTHKVYIMQTDSPFSA